MRHHHSVLTGFALALVSACAVGPNYKRPDVEPVNAYKEVGDWKPSAPADAIDRGAWWNIFGDDDLDQLERQVNISNQNVRAAVAAYDQAHAMVQQSQAGFWPQVSATASRERGNQGPSKIVDSAGVSANWDIDIWGQLRRTLESGRSWFYSRSRQEYWQRGETSGDRQWVRDALYDCDGDTLLILVDQEGRGACHNGTWSCFERSFRARAAPE